MLRFAAAHAWLGLALAASASAACSLGSPAEPPPVPAMEPAASAAPGSNDAPPPPSAGAGADVGSVTLHRLNGVEYDNTVRDLLGDTSHPSAAFPPDDGAYGFTNIADALTISPLLFEQYDTAAEKLAAEAIANPRIMLCDPAASSAEACTSAILAPFLARAWRRPVGAEEVARLAAVAANARVQGVPFDVSIAVAIKAALVSPSFLFRVETDPDPNDPTPHALDDYELANRLSYFLWSSMPDDALFALAGAGELTKNPQTFEREVRRMLLDPKARALVDGFASEWLMHDLGDAAPDPTIFPAWNDGLRASMAGETRAFFGTFLFGDQSLLDVLDAPFTFVDPTLASYYGVPYAGAGDFVQVALGPDTHRGGLLGQGSILTMTSVPTRTSVVRRGEWVLAELLCSPPPPPPPGVPALPETASSGTMRQRLDEHANNPACASCHTQLDPIGFALEHYDGIGRWRDADQGQPIDATGTLPTGQTFDGEAGLAGVLKADPRFPACATHKLYAYALGRVPQSFDEPRIQGLVAAFAAGGYRARDLMMTLVRSDAFLMRRGGS